MALPVAMLPPAKTRNKVGKGSDKPDEAEEFNTLRCSKPEKKKKND
jgi:hypothetical protein